MHRVLYSTAALFLAMPLSAQQSRSLTPRQIAAHASQAVVSIRAIDAGETVATGSGFIVRSDGVIVTNLHVVEDGAALEVSLKSGEVYDNVYVLSRDERRDLIFVTDPGDRLAGSRLR